MGGIKKAGLYEEKERYELWRDNVDSGESTYTCRRSPLASGGTPTLEGFLFSMISIGSPPPPSFPFLLQELQLKFYLGFGG